MRTLLPLLLAITFAACGSETQSSHSKENQSSESSQKQQQTQQKMYDELMKAHDDVMPLTPDLNRTKRALAVIAEPMQDSNQKASLKTQIELLRSSNEEMSDWMYRYNEVTPENLREAGLNHGQVMDSLGTIRKEILNIASKMRASLDAGKQAVEHFMPAPDTLE